MTTSRLPRVFRLLALAALPFAALALRAADPVAFDIPAQPAPAALKQFTKQSGAQVVYIQDELASVTTQAIKGEFTPAEALARLLEGTGFTAEPTGNGNFTIARIPAVKPGSIEGNVQNESGRPVAGARVILAGSNQAVITDKRGRFFFDEVPAGLQALAITAEGMQNTKVTDVNVKAGHRLTLSTIAIPVAVTGAVQLEDYIVSAKKNAGVIELDPYSVEGRREKPFVSGNMDIPRTTNDVQPYYVFDAKTIEMSGAGNLELFLKEKLTMNAIDTTGSQIAAFNSGIPRGNTSEINLRGLGADKTLVLVNGRRMAGVTIANTDYQPDINGIPLSAIDRIEVLPSSASGIYGGSAIGGVVNVILKKDYIGGEIRFNYNNTWDTDRARRSYSISYGMALEGGRTHFRLSASRSDSNVALLQDRRALLEGSIATITRNSPQFLFGSTTPWIGALPNIRAAGSALLVLKDGRPLNSNITYIESGTSSNMPLATLANSLLANAGTWNLELPPTAQNPTGLKRPLAANPRITSISLSARRAMNSRIETFLDLTYAKNQSSAILNHTNIFPSYPILSTAPNNPFAQTIIVNFPLAADIPQTTVSDNRSATIGVIAHLPCEWTAEFDYTWSQNEILSNYYLLDNAINNAIQNGLLNPLVDTLAYPVAFDKYLYPNSYTGDNILHDLELRGTGTILRLPWGDQTLTLGMGRRMQRTSERVFVTELPVTKANSVVTTYYPRKQSVDSAYAETLVPLTKRGALPLVDTLDLQLAGRIERFTLDTGTPSDNYFYNQTPPLRRYANPTLDGQPFKAEASYISKNYTFGVKYSPIKDLVFRASRATAFLPPTPTQLTENPQPNANTTTITDPVTNSRYGVQTFSGGNAALKPQHSISQNLGIIWEPQWRLLKGLRINAEYYRIEQFDEIGSLSAQLIVNDEAVFQDRVNRNSSGTITSVDVSLLNLYHRETTGWDLNVDYSIKTQIGQFGVRMSSSVIDTLKAQYSRTLPEYDMVNFPAEGGAVKYKRSAAVSWEWRGWTASWSLRYFGAHKIYGATGGRLSQQANGGTAPGSTLYIPAQGGETIASQIYHDCHVGYTFGEQKRTEGTLYRRLTNAMLDGLAIRVGIGNVFGEAPPLDASRNASTYYLSPYGDLELRTYWITAKKAF